MERPAATTAEVQRWRHFYTDLWSRGRTRYSDRERGREKGEGEGEGEREGETDKREEEKRNAEWKTAFAFFAPAPLARCAL